MIRCVLALLLATFVVTALCASDVDGDTVSLSTASKVAGVTLPPGLYRVRVQGSLAFFIDVTTKKSFSALVKVEKTAKKSTFTAAQGRTVDGTQFVDTIVLQGADYKLVF